MKKITLSDEQVLEIVDLLKNTDKSYDYISSKYSIKKHYISSINTGKRYSELTKDEKYPIRKASVKAPKSSMIDTLSEKQIKEIIQLLEENKVKFEDIGKHYNINRESVGKINSGNFNHSFLGDITFPIRTKHIRQEKGASSLKFSEKEINQIVQLIKNTNMTFTEIADKFNTTSWTISMINNGHRYTKLLADETFPLRKDTVTTQANSTSKLSEEDILKIIELLKDSKDSLRAIGKKFNIDNSVIARINNGKAWSNITSKYISEYPIRKK